MDAFLQGEAGHGLCATAPPGLMRVSVGNRRPRRLGESHDHVIGKLPKEYKDLVSGDFVFDATPLDSLPAYQRLVNERGYHRKNFSLLFKHGPARAMSIVLAETILKLRYLFGA